MEKVTWKGFCLRCLKKHDITVPFLPKEEAKAGTVARLCEACCQQLLWQAQTARERTQVAAGWL